MNRSEPPRYEGGLAEHDLLIAGEYWRFADRAGQVAGGAGATTDRALVTSDRESLTSDHERLTTDHERLTTDHERLTTDHERLTSDRDVAMTNGTSMTVGEAVPTTFASGAAPAVQQAWAEAIRIAVDR